MREIDKKAQVKRVQKKYDKLEKEKILAVKKKIKKLKGTRFTGQFICDMCKHTRMIGYLYTTEDAEYEICKFCRDTIFDVGHHTKLIYTPMGNKR